MLKFECLPVGEIQANAYVLYDTERDDALVIDPGAESDAIRVALGGRKIAAILLTHGHFDHIGAVDALREGATVVIHKADARMLTNPALNLSAMVTGKALAMGEADLLLEEGAHEMAGLPFEALHTPGHSPGSCCFRFGEALFTGDTLFRQGYGRTDLPGGDMRTLVRSLKRVTNLNADWMAYPGHGEPTTLGAERRYGA